MKRSNKVWQIHRIVNSNGKGNYNPTGYNFPSHLYQTTVEVNYYSSYRFVNNFTYYPKFFLSHEDSDEIQRINKRLLQIFDIKLFKKGKILSA